MPAHALLTVQHEPTRHLPMRAVTTSLLLMQKTCRLADSPAQLACLALLRRTARPGMHACMHVASCAACPRDGCAKRRRRCQRAFGRASLRCCAACVARRPPTWRFRVFETAPKPTQVNFNGRTYSFEVKPGPAGYREFTEAIRRAFNLPQDSELNITFTCDEPTAGGAPAGGRSGGGHGGGYRTQGPSSSPSVSQGSGSSSGSLADALQEQGAAAVDSGRLVALALACLVLAVAVWRGAACWHVRVCCCGVGEGLPATATTPPASFQLQKVPAAAGSSTGAIAAVPWEGAFNCREGAAGAGAARRQGHRLMLMRVCVLCVWCLQSRRPLRARC